MYILEGKHGGAETPTPRCNLLPDERLTKEMPCRQSLTTNCWKQVYSWTSSMVRLVLYKYYSQKDYHAEKEITQEEMLTRIQGYRFMVENSKKEESSERDPSSVVISL